MSFISKKETTSIFFHLPFYLGLVVLDKQMEREEKTIV
jgi:hypothetical protein